MAEYAGQYIQNPDLRSVTVKGKGKFRIDEYEGPISDIENAKALLSWEKKIQTGSEAVLHPMHGYQPGCRDHPEYYNVRWEIETGDRYFKELLGFDQYQLLSFKAIERYWTIQYMVQNFLEFQRYEWSKVSPLTLGETVRRIRKMPDDAATKAAVLLPPYVKNNLRSIFLPSSFILSLFHNCLFKQARKGIKQEKITY